MQVLKNSAVSLLAALTAFLAAPSASATDPVKDPAAKVPLAEVEAQIVDCAHALQRSFSLIWGANPQIVTFATPVSEAAVRQYALARSQDRKRLSSLSPVSFVTGDTGTSDITQLPEIVEDGGIALVDLDTRKVSVIYGEAQAFAQNPRGTALANVTCAIASNAEPLNPQTVAYNSVCKIPSSRNSLELSIKAPATNPTSLDPRAFSVSLGVANPKRTTGTAMTAAQLRKAFEPALQTELKLLTQLFQERVRAQSFTLNAPKYKEGFVRALSPGGCGAVTGLLSPAFGEIYVSSERAYLQLAAGVRGGPQAALHALDWLK